MEVGPIVLLCISVESFLLFAASFLNPQNAVGARSSPMLICKGCATWISNLKGRLLNKHQIIRSVPWPHIYDKSETYLHNHSHCGMENLRTIKHKHEKKHRIRLMSCGCEVRAKNKAPKHSRPIIRSC